MKKLLFALSFVLAMPLLLIGQQDFEEFLKQDQADQDAFTEEFLNAYNAYVEADRAAYENFRRDVERQWGDFTESSQKDWVEYSEDLTWRTKVDFETGTAEVEVLVDPVEAQDPVKLERKLEAAVEELVTTQGRTKDYAMADEKPLPLKAQPVLKDQVRTKENKAVTPSNARQFAKEIVKEKPIEKKQVRTKEGNKVRVSVNLSLVPNHAKVRAEEYKKSVGEYSKKYKVDPALVYAVIHTESSFNPKAKSHIPAFGLMQIVPKYAGRDAYKLVYKQDKLLNANYLFDAGNNIELGVAYLHILQTRYFSDISNEASRTYCTIAAYNTGAGNVARAFNGTTNIRKAVPNIDKMSPEQVYRTMKRNLPYDETKNYLDKVSQRMEDYRKG